MERPLLGVLTEQLLQEDRVVSDSDSAGQTDRNVSAGLGDKNPSPNLTQNADTPPSASCRTLLQDPLWLPAWHPAPCSTSLQNPLRYVPSFPGPWHCPMEPLRGHHLLPGQAEVQGCQLLGVDLKTAYGKTSNTLKQCFTQENVHSTSSHGSHQD